MQESLWDSLGREGRAELCYVTEVSVLFKKEVLQDIKSFMIQHMLSSSTVKHKPIKSYGNSKLKLNLSFSHPSYISNVGVSSGGS